MYNQEYPLPWPGSFFTRRRQRQDERACNNLQYPVNYTQRCGHGYDGKVNRNVSCWFDTNWMFLAEIIIQELYHQKYIAEFWTKPEFWGQWGVARLTNPFENVLYPPLLSKKPFIYKKVELTVGLQEAQEKTKYIRKHFQELKLRQPEIEREGTIALPWRFQALAFSPFWVLCPLEFMAKSRTVQRMQVPTQAVLGI